MKDRLRVVTPQQAGRDYEQDLVTRYGGKAQPGSGAGDKYKLDWKLGGLLFSAKRTQAESYRLTAAELREALAGSQGPGGRGEIPAMAIRMAGFDDDVWVVRGSDMRAIFEGEVEVSIESTKRSAKLAAAAPRQGAAP